MTYTNVLKLQDVRALGRDLLGRARDRRVGAERRVDLADRRRSVANKR